MSSQANQSIYHDYILRRIMIVNNSIRPTITIMIISQNGRPLETIESTKERSHDVSNCAAIKHEKNRPSASV